MVMTVKAYLKENVDEHVTIDQWQDKNKLPVFLRNIYNFYEMIILDNHCILLEILDDAPGIDMIVKHIKRIEELTNQQIVLCYRRITRYRRKSLIKSRIPFVIEDGQIYLPFLGLDLKNVGQYVDEEVNTFSTSAQLAYLYFLYNKGTMINTTEFAERMGFTVMTASRALNDLYDAKLITYKIGGKTGRSKEYRRISDPKYFEKGRTYMKSPVKKVVYVKIAPKDALIAGLDALAELSMINPPGHPVRAISRRQLNKNDFRIIKNKDLVKDQKLVELEVWDYDPKLITDKKHVDPMSLYASLKEKKDERIEQALEEVLRGEIWYMD
ncbi:MAG: MarR family transcriptional regulator [Firmicutes bacterium]|nr:MarR family transcriptional regulator [Bacillota bacterium]